MTGREFELLVKKALEKEFKKSDFPIEIFHLQKFRAADGYSYEIDISYKFSIADIEYWTIVECKYWDQNISRDILNNIHSKLLDLKAHKGIVVSKKGFQSGAIAFAKHHNIGLIKIANEDEIERYSNFGGGIKDIETILIKESKVLESGPYKITGLITPSVDVFNFIAGYCGKEFAGFLKNGEIENYLDVVDKRTPPYVSECLKKLPKDFLREYIFIETCGLPLRLTNELELRLVNMSVFMLRMED